MIYCDQRKICIFTVPIIGTHPIQTVFESIPITKDFRVHVNYVVASQAYNIADFSTYRFFGFYCDPVLRFHNSFMSYKNKNYDHLLRMFYTEADYREALRQIKVEKYNRFLNMRKRYAGESSWLSQSIKDLINGLTVTDLLNKFTFDKINQTNDDAQVIKKGIDVIPPTFLSQKFWLNHNINLTMLDFADFDNKLKALALEFGVILDTVPSDDSIVNDGSTLTTAEIDLIKQFYQPDYDFFASKGIVFQ